jgi:acetolactate synthase-1/2/3 large subunit
MEINMSQMTGGEAVIQALQREGVEVVFGLPGVQIMSLYDAFYNRSDIQIMTVRHEQTAVYMADGYSRVTGKPGVALVAPGPGVQNASAALGTAYASSSPVLLLAGQVESVHIGKDRGALHEINDQQDVVRPVTKWCRRVNTCEEIPSTIHEAVQQMQSGRPRPVEVEIPPDILERTAGVHFVPKEKLKPKPPDHDLVRQAVELLRKAQKPLIFAGGGVRLSGASRELEELAQNLGAPVATTAEGKGAIPEDHPLALGVTYYGHGTPRFASPKADVILAVGTMLTQMATGHTVPRAPQKLIHLDIDPDVIGRNYPADVGIVADAREGLKALLREVRQVKGPSRWPDEELLGMREDQERWLRENAPHQCEILRSIQRVLDEDAIIVSGLTNLAYWSYLAYRVQKPGKFITSSYFATLGYSFPLSLGARVGAQESAVVAITGDGGFMYGLPELATAAQYNLSVIVIVFVDNAFGASKNDQQLRYQGRVVGTELKNPSFAEVARVFGVQGIRSEPEKLDKALEDALESQRPTVIEVPIGTWIPPFQIATLKE